MLFYLSNPIVTGMYSRNTNKGKAFRFDPYGTWNTSYGNVLANDDASEIVTVTSDPALSHNILFPASRVCQFVTFNEITLTVSFQTCSTSGADSAEQEWRPFEGITETAGVQGFSVGGWFSCIQNTAGEVLCFGDNSVGNMGFASRTSQSNNLLTELYRSDCLICSCQLI